MPKTVGGGVEATRAIPVVQTLTITKTGANWDDLNEAKTEFKTVTKNNPSKVVIPDRINKFTEKFEWVDSDTIKLIRKWTDWYDFEASYNARRKKVNPSASDTDNVVQNWWKDNGWTIDEVISDGR
tara:strand:- start:1643 stop:2020 length:378 start_codon:yes stop_codon:yes gene_type:complete